MSLSLTLPVGLTGSYKLEVEEKHCTQRGAYKIFSTPNMVQLLEWACIDALSRHLSEGQISVGSKVDVRHLAPSPIGSRVRAEAVAREVDGTRVVFEVEIFDEIEKVGSAVHERHVLEFERYIRRLEKKIAASAAAR